MADPSVQRIRAREQHVDLPRIGERSIEGRTWAVFELSGTASNSAEVEVLDLELEIGRRLERHRISLCGGLRLNPELGAEPVDAESEDSERVYGLLGRHVDLIYGSTDGMRAVDGAGIGLDLSEFLAAWRKSEDIEKAKLALIVRLAEAVGRTVSEVAERPRRILRRRRSMERASSVRQIDPAGVRWLVRQPGRNLVERAGPRQRILAVVRDESVDTLENRVVRDLLDRSASEARLWLRDNRDFKNTARWETVDRYHSSVRRWRRVGPLADVRPVRGSVEPNYVLQHDSRYSKIWPWYQLLRRRQEQEDQLWRWSHRTFAESLRLVLAWAVDELASERPTHEAPLYQRVLVLRSEQQHGEFVDARSQFAGWLLGTDSGTRSVAILHGDQIRRFEARFNGGSRIHELAPDALVVLHDPYRAGRPHRLLAVWARLRFDSAATHADTALELANAVARRRGCLDVGAALVEPSPASAVRAEIDLRRCSVTEGDPVSLWTVCTPLRPAKTRIKLGQLLRESLIDGVVA